VGHSAPGCGHELTPIQAPAQYRFAQVPGRHGFATFGTRPHSYRKVARLPGLDFAHRPCPVPALPGSGGLQYELH
jgi:hypothetical protein